ncbi:MAG TPA: hypothetical protein VMT34_16890, partial [Aggregatilineales bacterium]|nr:hypothetical protein [Aggregatilineales bacterium]
FVNDNVPDLTPANIRIDGGTQITGIHAITVRTCHADNPVLTDCVTITLDREGDFSTYRLSLVEPDDHGRPGDRRLAGFSPQDAAVDFHFRVDCPSDLDCAQTDTCPPEPLDEPEISYLGRDYAAFRQLILDRLALIMPDWKERHVPDLGIMLAELFAYTGDYLSYYQDAVATEAYLDTARLRTSVRRHARLVDYVMHDGCNARAWVCLEADEDFSVPADQVAFITGIRGESLGAVASAQILLDRGLLPDRYETFEPMLWRTGKAALLTTGDVVDAPGLVGRLQTAVSRNPSPGDPISNYLAARLSPGTLDLLKAYKAPAVPVPALVRALLDDLNRVLRYDDLWWLRDQVQDAPDSAQTSSPPRSRSDPIVANRRILAYKRAYANELRSIEGLYFYAAHSEIPFYTWGDRDCCLPKGATRATLRDAWADVPAAPPVPGGPNVSVQPRAAAPDFANKPRQLKLQPGDVLIFEEVIGPKTGQEADRDPLHRCAVRLTRVEPDLDPLYGKQPVLYIEWDRSDALPFPLCLSATSEAPECAYHDGISVARGNVILVDHGRTLPPETLPDVEVGEEIPPCDDCGDEAIRVPRRYRPRLSDYPVTFSAPLQVSRGASTLPGQDPRQALPAIRKLTGTLSTPNGQIAVDWQPQRDLLSSQTDDYDFVAEIEDDGGARLRFGDGELGHQPPAGMHFIATYRVGNGTVGNVGAEAITILVFLKQAV